VADYLDSLVKRGVISDDAAARMMTHQAEQPNPVPDALQSAATAAGNFASGGLQRALGLPNNFVGEALQSPDNQMVMPGLGMATPKYVNPGATTLRNLIKQGKTLNEIGSQYGVSAPAVHKWLRAFEITPNAAGRTPIDLDRVETLLRQGKTINEIAPELGVNPRSIYNARNVSRSAPRDAPDWFKEEMKQ
jgi:transposase-like protein